VVHSLANCVSDHCRLHKRLLCIIVINCQKRASILKYSCDKVYFYLTTLFKRKGKECKESSPWALWVDKIKTDSLMLMKYIKFCFYVEIQKRFSFLKPFTFTLRLDWNTSQKSVNCNKGCSRPLVTQAYVEKIYFHVSYLQKANKQTINEWVDEWMTKNIKRQW